MTHLALCSSGTGSVWSIPYHRGRNPVFVNGPSFEVKLVGGLIHRTWSLLPRWSSFSRRALWCRCMTSGEGVEGELSSVLQLRQCPRKTVQCWIDIHFYEMGARSVKLVYRPLILRYTWMVCFTDYRQRPASSGLRAGGGGGVGTLEGRFHPLNGPSSVKWYRPNLTWTRLNPDIIHVPK